MSWGKNLELGQRTVRNACGSGGPGRVDVELPVGVPGDQPGCACGLLADEFWGRPAELAHGLAEVTEDW